MYQLRLRPFLRALLFQLGWLTLLLMSARFAMYHAFVEPAQLVGKQDDLLRMWTTGLRYDLRIGGMALAPWLVLALPLAASQRTWRWLQKIVPILFAILAFVVAAVAISNFFYYQTYHTHIDMFAFGLMDDDTKAVLANMWQDYPLVKGVLAALIAALVSGFITKRLLAGSPDRHWPSWRLLLTTLLIVAVVAIAARGSVGTFPLRRGNAQVSDLTVLNKLTPNGLIAIDWALKDRRDDVSFSKVSAEEGKALLAQMGFTSLDVTTPSNPWLAEHKPHVVMNLMESFGSNMLAFDQQGVNDLLGALRPAFASDFVFRRFVSEGNGTAPSLAAMFFHSPVQTISHSSAQSVKLSGIPFDVYKKAGYRVIFISPGNMMWRNLVNYLPVQGVDEVFDQNALMKRYPQSAKELTDWGVPDEYAYRLAETLLKEANQPTFISILTVTNHPPYVVPTHYQPGPVALTDEVKRHAEEGQIDQLNILRTYQYAADAFGRFVANIKASKLGEKTLIAATGDHQMRRVRAFYPAEQMLDRAVPFYLYVPKTIQQHVPLRFDPTRVGSHKDIFPTLYAFSLSDTTYQALGGRNMLAVDDDPARAFGYNELVWIDKKGAYPLTGKQIAYAWHNSSLTLNEQPLQQTPEEAKSIDSYPKLLRWQINARIKGMK